MVRAYNCSVVNVKGSALSSRILWVQLGHGAAGTDRLLDQATPELRMNIERGFSKAQWYPFDQFIELNIVIDRLFGRGDLGLVKQLGRYGADANLTTIYRLFFKVGTAQWILGRSVRLWSAHYDSGYCEVSTRGSRSAILRIRGFDDAAPGTLPVGGRVGGAFDRALGRQAADPRGGEVPHARRRAVPARGQLGLNIIGITSARVPAPGSAGNLSRMTFDMTHDSAALLPSVLWLTRALVT